MTSNTSPFGTALVTGAGKRLGRAIALGLARAGWDIAVHYHRSASEAQAVVTEIRALDRRAVSLAADLSNEDSVLALFEAAQSQLAPLTCLVNNASRFELDQPADFTSANLEQHMRPNLAAPLLLARKLHESAQSHGQDAVVINLLDQKLENLNPDFFSYTLSKAALLAATKMMAMAFSPQVRVNGVSPGATLQSWEQSDGGFEQANKIALLRRSSGPDDIVQAVVYLAQAKAVTGVNLIVDGGQHLMPLDRDVMFLTERL
jgi:NAD(P)-dependent dehydrogenase (short-subunit alcohol dehydrogenase family)